MSDGEFRQAGQSDSREGSAGDHDLAGDADELVVSRFEIGVENERRQFDHAFADATQAGVGGDDEGGADPAADDIFVNEERANRICRLPAGLGRDHQSGERLNFFGQGLCVTK
jgi:hypothetical protein